MTIGFRFCVGRLCLGVGLLVVFALSATGSEHPNLVGYYAFDEGSGSAANDTSGSNNNGTIVGSPTWVPGMKNMCLQLSGSGQYVQVAHTDSIDPISGWTLAAYVRRANMNANHSVLESYTVPGGNYALRITNGNKAQVYIVNYPNNSQAVTGATTLTSNQWYHMAATYDSATSQLKLYVDGNLEGSASVPFSSAHSQSPVYIGARGTDHLDNFAGNIDEARVYNRALNPAEISAIIAGSPVASSDSYRTSPSQPLSVSAPGILVNDGGFKSANISAVLDTSVSHGMLTLNANGSFNYTPANSYIGLDTFTYHVADDVGGTSASVAVALRVEANATALGLVAYYKFDESSGSSAYDSSGNFNDGTLINAPLHVSGNVNNSLSFNGSNQYVEIPHSNAIDPITGWTLAAFVRRTSLNAQHSIIESYQNPGGNFAMRVASTNVLRGYLLNYPSNELPIDGTSTIGANVWYHVAVTYDGQKLKTYVNGNLESSVNVQFSPSHSTTPLYIGACGGDHVTNFAGNIDEARVYARALSAVEVNAIASTKPIAVADSYTTIAGANLNISSPGVLGNDAAYNYASLTAVRDADVTHGGLTLNANGSFTYTPAPGYIGADSFTYHIDDGNGGVSTPIAVALQVTNLGVTSITPVSGYNGQQVLDAVVNGSGFRTGSCAVKLKKGSTEISGTSVRVTLGTSLLVNFDLSGTGAGVWDVVVTDTSAALSATLPGAFTTSIPNTLVVTNMTPSPNSTATLSLSGILLDFSKPVLNTSISTNSVLLVGAGQDNLFDTADDVAITLPAGNLTQPTSSQLSIGLGGITLSPGKYRVSLIGAIRGTTGSSDAIVTVPNFGMVAPTDNYTIEFWQYFTGGEFHLPTTFQLTPIIAGNVYQFHSPWNSGPDYFFWDLGNDRKGITNINTRGVWSHFALVKSGSTVSVFWNGNQIYTSTLTSSFTNYAADLQLPAGQPQPFLGRIDEFRIWNGVRSGTQIKNYMKRTLTGTELGLMAYWDFNEGSGSTANDKTGHGYNGMMGGAPVWNLSDVPLLPAITEIGGSALDGEFNGTFPSGNGAAGGDFSAIFTLTNTPPPPFKISAMTPAPDSTQTSAVTSILLTSTWPFDPQTVNSNTVKVKRAGPDGNLDTGDDVSVTATGISVVGGNQIKIDLPNQATASEKYRVTVSGTTAPIVKDLNGSTLDGEYPGSGGGFPSGNGTAGGDFTAAYQVNLFTTTTVVNAVTPVTYGTAAVALSATVSGGPVQNVNTGTVTFQLKKGAANVGSAVSGNVTASVANVSCPIPVGTPIGTYSVAATYSGGGLFTSSSDNSQSFDIQKAQIMVVTANTSRLYAAANPNFTGTVTGVQYSENITATYATSATSTSNTGNYPIVATLVDPSGKLVNYTTTITNSVLTVTPAPLTVTGANANRPYGAANPAFAGTITGLKNSDDITASYSTTATVLSNVGPHPIVPTLVDPGNKLGNYAVTLNNGTLTITKIPLSAAAFNNSRAYGAPNPVFVGTLFGVINGDNILAIYTTAAVPGSPIGLYPILPQFADPDGRLDNYTLNLSNGTLEVTKAALTVTPADVTRPIGSPNPAFVGAIIGIQNEDRITAAYSTSATPDSALGTYPIVAALDDPDNKLGNYNVSVNTGTLTVIPATPPTITSVLSATVAKDAPFSYTITADGSVPMTFFATGLPPGLALAGADIAGIPTGTGVFSVTLGANNFGGSDTKILKLTVIGSTVNHAPSIVSNPTVSSNPATTGVPVTFSAQATDSDADALAFTWDFGDGTSGDGSNVFKTYAAAGVYVVTLTVSDGQATTFQSLNVVVQQQPSAGSFNVDKAKLAFNFIKPGKDSLALSGRIPVAVGFNPSGKKVRVLTGRLDIMLEANAKGHLGSAKFNLRVKKGSGNATYSLSLMNQDLFNKLESLGFSKTQSGGVTMPVIFVLDGNSFIDRPVLQYAAKGSKNGPASGKAKK